MLPKMELTCMHPALYSVTLDVSVLSLSLPPSIPPKCMNLTSFPSLYKFHFHHTHHTH